MKYIFSILFCCFLIPCFAQVFPGDANNNGAVDHCDILPIGYAFGEVGPARLEESTGAFEQEVTSFWENAFPDGSNYAHADANGDGIVDFMDLVTVFYNYGITHEELTPLPIIPGTAGIDVPLYFDMPQLSEPLTAGSALEIPIYLGTENIPVNNLHGLAFTIEYQRDFFEEVVLNLNPVWFATDELFLFEGPVNEDDNASGIAELDVAVTHFGKEHATSGYGQIGTLSIIIQDVLVDLMSVSDSAEVVLSAGKIAMYNQQFELESVVEDSVELMIYHPQALTSAAIPTTVTAPEIYPNPTPGVIVVESYSPLEWIELYDSKGVKVLVIDGAQRQQIRLNLQQRSLAPGLYTAILYNQEGQHIKKLAYTR
jgi:hypothetical protein